MKEMIEKAKEQKYAYLGFTEHNPSLSRHNLSQTYEILKLRSNFIEQLKSEYKKVIHIFSMPIQQAGLLIRGRVMIWIGMRYGAVTF